jgi:enoyl-CoA hydratase
MKIFETLRVEMKNSVLTLTIHRPEKLNALSEQVFRELKDLFLDLKQGQFGLIRGMILTGAGEKAFIAGADIQRMSQMTAEEGENFAAQGQEISRMIESLLFPVIACVNGYALGGGCEMAMSCDYIFATERAVFGQPEVNLGLIPCFGGCVRLLRLVGPGRAKELIYTGRNVKASEAKAIGLINEIFQTREEMLLAAEMSFELMAQKSPVAIQICKQVLGQMFGKTTEESLQIERSGFHLAFESSDKKEGVSAFLEKRSARF